MEVPVQDHLRQLREKVGNLKPVPTIAHGTAKTNVPDRLLKAKFVFVRTDARKTPLQTPFTGPYAVIDRNNKFFTLQMGNKQDTVSIDRLKEAIAQDDGFPVPVAQPPRRGRPPVLVPGSSSNQPRGPPTPAMTSPPPTPSPTPSPTPETTPPTPLPVPVPTYAE